MNENLNEAAGVLWGFIYSLVLCAVIAAAAIAVLA